MTQRHIITVSLESIKTKRQLKALFHDERLHVENTEAREGFETYRIPINKRLFVLEVCSFTNTHCKPQQRLDRYFLLPTQDVDAATDMVLDRAFQKPKPQVVNAPPPAPVPRSRRDSAREPWQAQYDDLDDTEAMAAAVADDEDEEMNLATLLNVIDGSTSLLFCIFPYKSVIRFTSTRTSIP